ncbi:MAG: hypothetical protein HXY40_08220 [Chloroflexi bacterium]|nr:hypothetical protein [Chloroflexota bacterium]
MLTIARLCATYQDDTTLHNLYPPGSLRIDTLYAALACYSVCEPHQNGRAQRFWRRVIGQYREEAVSDGKRNRPIFR